MSASSKLKNVITDVSGKAKEALGKVTGDSSTEAEGKRDQTKADLRKAAANIKSSVKH